MYERERRMKEGVRMDDKFVNILIAKFFGEISSDEIVQAIRIAEMQSGGDQPSLVFVRVKNACIDKVRRSAFERKLFTPIDDIAPGSEPFTENDFRESERQWAETLATMPRDARRLAEIAEDVAQTFVPHDGESIWTRKNKSRMLEIIKRRFIETDWNHSRRAYHRARKRLLQHLNRRRA